MIMWLIVWLATILVALFPISVKLLFEEKLCETASAWHCIRSDLTVFGITIICCSVLDAAELVFRHSGRRASMNSFAAAIAVFGVIELVYLLVYYGFVLSTDVKIQADNLLLYCLFRIGVQYLFLRWMRHYAGQVKIYGTSTAESAAPTLKGDR